MRHTLIFLFLSPVIFYILFPALFIKKQNCLIEHLAAGVFEKVKHKLETGGSFIIRIRHTIRPGMIDREIAHPHDLLLLFQSWSGPAKIGDITVVHTHKQVEIAEIRRTHGPASVIESKPASKSGLTHPHIRQVARMTAIESCGIEFEPVFNASVTRHLTQHTLGSRTPADIAKTHKKNSDRAFFITGSRHCFFQGLHGLNGWFTFSIFFHFRFK